MDSGDQASPAPWSNPTIAVDRLPRLDESSFVGLDPAYRRMRTAMASTTALGTAVAATLVVIAADHVAVTVWALAMTSIVLAVCAVYRLEADRMSYLVREHDVSFARGVFGRSVATVPFARVQHVSIGRGPIDRRFGLATLTVRSAGGSITIPGLTADVAERLKAIVSGRAAELAEAEVAIGTDPAAGTPDDDHGATWPPPSPRAADRARPAVDDH